MGLGYERLQIPLRLESKRLRQENKKANDAKKAKA